MRTTEGNLKQDALLICTLYYAEIERQTFDKDLLFTGFLPRKRDEKLSLPHHVFYSCHLQLRPSLYMKSRNDHTINIYFLLDLENICGGLQHDRNWETNAQRG